ncbi:MAG: TetR/AcrR family transcriptional regulator [Myxococcota bacterium]
MTALRRTILDKAVELVAEHGVRGVSFREVARRAEVSHQAPYHHFGNLQGILEAIAREGFAQLAATMQSAANQAGEDALERLTAAGTAYVRFAISHLGYFRVMFQRSLVELHDELSPIEEAQETFGTLVTLAEDAWKAGHGSHMAVEVLSLLAWSTVHGLAILIVEGTIASKPNLPPEDVLIDQVVGALSGLLKAP